MVVQRRKSASQFETHDTLYLKRIGGKKSTSQFKTHDILYVKRIGEKVYFTVEEVWGRKSASQFKTRDTLYLNRTGGGWGESASQLKEDTRHFIFEEDWDK